MVYDFAIIGGGVVGSAIFNKLTRVGKKCVLLEIQNDVGFGASRANSGILHTGFDCKPNTLKAKLNVRGFEIYPNILNRLGVPYKENGHLVVGNDLKKLEELMQRGINNGVENLKIINQAELQVLEPNLNKDIKYALYAPHGKIVSSYELAVKFTEESLINGSDVLLKFNTKEILKDNDIFSLSDGKSMVKAKNLVNACASGFNDIAKLIGSETYDFKFRRGEYYVLDKVFTNFCSHTIFPLPTKDSKGVLITNTAGGNILVGPTSYESTTSTKTTSVGLKSVKELALTEMPNLPIKSGIRVFSGVRSLVGDDFVIEKSKFISNVVNVAGICSPGLTSAPAIAEMVCELFEINPNNEKKNLKKLKKQIKMNELSKKEQAEIISRNPEYGKIICKCEEISLGEIKDAINSPLKAATVDAVKRRTRAGMGRCQGGFCIFSIMEQLAKNNKTNFDDIEKDSEGSKIIVCDIKAEDN